ncbi:MAG: ATP-binding protein [Anaeromyxobacter sp.]
MGADASADGLHPAPASWRDPALRRLLLGLVVFVPIDLAANRLRAQETPAWLFLLAALWALALAGWALAHRRRPVRAVLALVTLDALALLLLPLFQGRAPGPASAVALATAITFATLFLGWRALAGCVLLVALATALAHGLARAGRVPLQQAAPFADGWLAQGVQLVGSWALLALVVSTVLRSYQEGARRLHEGVEALVQRRAEREQAEAQRWAAAEAARRAQDLELVGRLTAGLAHDFNNSLTVIMSWAGALRDPVGAGLSQAEASQAIAAGAERAELVTRRLAALRRQEPGPRRRVELGEVAAALARSARWVVPPTCPVLLRRAEPAAVLAVPAQLEQALLQLVLNARDAQPGGGRIEVEVGWARPEEVAGLPPGSYAAARVRDHGVGLDPFTRAHLFEPFFTTKADGAGLGLGLAVAREVAVAHGGRIHVESAPGAGSTFSLVLPAAGPAPLPAQERPARALPPGRRVLLVEDEPLVRRAMARALRAAGGEVIEASTGEAGLAAAALPGLELLCLDAVLPDLASQRVADAFTRAHPGRPVLVCSGHVEEDELRQRIALGDYAFLAKPFDGATLVARAAALMAAPAAAR